MQGILDSLFSHDPSAILVGPETLALVLVTALCMGQLIGWVYMATESGLSYSRSFVGSLVVLPVLIAVLMVLMSGSIVVALGLFAVFGVVRFRNAVKDTRDTVFVVWAVTQGMGVGILQFGTSLAGCAFVAAVMLYLRGTSFGMRTWFDHMVAIQMPGDPESLGLTRKILARHCLRVRAAEPSSLSDAMVDRTFYVLMRDPARTAELAHEIEATGIASVLWLRPRADESEL